MNIEEEIFNKYEINKDKLIKYGFKQEDNKLIFKKQIMNNKFIIIVEYNNEMKTKIIELEFQEEYMNYRRENLGEFSSKIKENLTNLLIDIRNKCCKKNMFKFDQTKRINDYINNRYKTNPEFLWKKFPNYAVYRKNKKWFCIIMNISKNKLNKDFSKEEIEIINVKVSEDNIENLLKQKGYFKAYHMNKEKWISIILDETLTDKEIEDMISDSYNIIN